MRPWLDGVLAVCAVAITAVVVLPRVGVRGADLPASSSSPGPVTLSEADWREVVAAARMIGGSSQARDTLIVFSDFECPACRSFYREVLEPVSRDSSLALVVGMVHYPLDYHRFALPAVRAAECAKPQDRFTEMHNRLFEAQDSLGLVPFSELGRSVNIPDSPAFSACMDTMRTPVAAIQGRELGRRVGVRATPTIVLNGIRQSAPPSLAELRRQLRHD